MRAKPLQKYKNKVVSNGYTLKPVKVTNLKSAKRLLSKLIYDLQVGKVDSKLAKDLTYLVSIYVNIHKEFELENKIDGLEERINQLPPIEINIKDSDEKLRIPFSLQ